MRMDFRFDKIPNGVDDQTLLICQSERHFANFTVSGHRKRDSGKWISETKYSDRDA